MQHTVHVHSMIASNWVVYVLLLTDAPNEPSASTSSEQGVTIINPDDPAVLSMYKCSCRQLTLTMVMLSKLQ